MKRIIIAIALLTLILAGCTSTPTGQATKEDTIKVGAIYMLTGIGSTQGAHSQKGAELAIEEINAAGSIGGKKLQLVVEDNQGDNPKEAINAYYNLKTQGIDIILGPNWSPSAQALAPLACQDKTLMISPSAGVASFAQKCEYTYNTWPPDSIASEALGQYVAEQGYDDILIIASQQVWEYEQGVAVLEGIRAAGKDAELIVTTTEERDFSSYAIKAREADAVIFTDYSYQYLAAKQFREQGIDAQYFAVLLADDHIEAAQGAFEGTIVVTAYTPTEAFIKKYEERYGEAPKMPADSSYDSIMLLAKAIEKSESADPETIAETLSTIKSYDGASGTLTFNEHGQAHKETTYMIVKDYKQVDYEG